MNTFEILKEYYETRAVGRDELPCCLDVIHRSFETVAEEFGLTWENCPKHTSFIPLEHLQTQFDWGWRMFALYSGDKIVGYVSVSKEADSWEMHNLSVLPEFRHRGYGERLVAHIKDEVRRLGGDRITIGIIAESVRLRDWYISLGFELTGEKKFDHLPFTVGFMEWRNSDAES